MSLCTDVPSVMQEIPDGHLHRLTYTICRIDRINSPDDGYIAVRNMQRIEINIHEERFMRQVGYLQRSVRYLFTDVWVKPDPELFYR